MYASDVLLRRNWCGTAAVVSLVCASYSAIPAAELTVTADSLHVAFGDRGPLAIKLSHGTRHNLLARTHSYPACGIYFKVGNSHYGSSFDHSATRLADGRTVRYAGELTNEHGQSPPGGAVPFTALWNIMPNGAIHVRFQVRLPASIEKGQLEYVFPFDYSRLPNYTYGGYRVNGRELCATAEGPLPAWDRDGVLFRQTGTIHGLNIELTHPRHEAVALAIDKGNVDRVVLERREAGVLRYRQPYRPGESVEASFYLLPAPLRRTVGMKRIYVMSEATFLGRPTDYIVDRLKNCGFRYLVYHHDWQLRKTEAQRTKNDTPVMFGSHRPHNPERLARLIKAAHAADIKVLGYFGFANEETLTDWFLESDGKRFSTGWTIRPTRHVMCTASPYFQHQLDDARVMLEDIGFDGLFVDWFTLIGCHQRHASHGNTPVSNMTQLLEFAEHVHAMNKELIVHAGEEGNIAFFTDLADEVVIGERPWSSVTFQTVHDGVFARRSSHAGRGGILYEPQYYQSEAMAALVGGLNPFGCVTGSLRRRGMEYVLDLMRQLAPYELENMQVVPTEARAFLSSQPDVASVVLTEQAGCLLFAVNTNPSASTIRAVLRPRPQRLHRQEESRVVVVDLETKHAVYQGKLSELAKTGIPVKVPAHECRLFYLRWSSGED